MPELDTFVARQIDALATQLRKYLDGQIGEQTMADSAWSVVDAWHQLPAALQQCGPIAHEDILWYSVWTVQHLADEEHRADGLAIPAFHECLDLLETRRPLPAGYSGRRP